MNVKSFLSLALASSMMIPGFAFPKSDLIPVDANKLVSEAKEVSDTFSGNSSYYSSSYSQNEQSKIQCKSENKDLNDLLFIKKEQVKSFIAMNYYINLFSENTTYIDGGVSSQSFSKTNLAFKEDFATFQKVLEIFDRNFPGPLMTLSAETYYYDNNADTSMGHYKADIEALAKSMSSTNSNTYDPKAYRRMYRLRSVIQAVTTAISKYNYERFFNKDKNCGITLMEFQSLYLYTGSGSYYMGKDETAPELKKYFVSLTKNMVALLKKLKPESRVVRIGTYLNKEEWEKIVRDGRISYGGFISGSVNNSYNSFAKNAVIKVTKNKTGSLISSFSQYPSEGEVIWYKPTFKIKSAVTDSRGKLWLEAEEL